MLDLRVVASVVQELELEGYLVDCDPFLTCVVLQTPCHECLREKETTHPKNVGSPVLDPLLQKPNPQHQILNPRPQRLQGQEPFTCPQLTHLIVKYIVGQFLKILTHHNKSFQSLFQVIKGIYHYIQQSVISYQLLHQHSVHGLVVICWEFLHYLLQWKQCRQFVLN